MKDQNGYNVRAVERALQILESFSDENPERGLSEIAQIVDLHKATTFRIVTTLVNFGFLERTTDGQKYRLGLRLASLGCNVISRLDLRREALPYMHQLVDEWGETCDLSVFEQGEVFYVEMLQGSFALTVAAAVGRRLPVHCTASGKVFLAYLPPDELDALLKRPLASYTEKTITSPDQLRQQLEEIRRLGYGMDDEELEIGVRAVSAPIRNQHGKVIAAMGIPSPVSRISLEQLPTITAALLESAQAISQRMGWHP
jgi:IclR family transcriptional regulator, KDG regulon repressor